LLNLFRQNTALAAFFALLLALALRMPLFFDLPQYNSEASGPLAVLMFKYIDKLQHPLLVSYILSTIIIVLQAVLLNYIFIRHDILYKISYMPAFVYILSSSLFPEQMQLSAQLLSNTFLLLMLLRLFYMYESDKPLFLVLDSGIYLGLAMLLYIDIVVFLPFIIISVVIFTSFNMRYIIVALLGIFIPIYFIGTYFYITNRLAMFLELTSNAIQGIEVSTTLTNYYQLIPLSILVFASFMGYVGLQQNYMQNKVKTRRILQSMMLLALFCLAIMLVEDQSYVYALFFINVPMSLAIGYYLISTKRLWFKEILAWILISCSLAFNLGWI
jgi:hypothetical protein